MEFQWINLVKIETKFPLHLEMPYAKSEKLTKGRVEMESLE